MTAPRKYNPGFLADDELVASFCVRTSEFESLVETLRECTGSANTHQIVIGPRGGGKTSLLLRVAAEIRRDAGLSSAFFPVVFAEESYEISTAGEFWLECLSRLADQAPGRQGGPDLRRSFEDLRAVRDDRTLGDRCLGALLDFADREDRRLVLTVENLNMMFRDMADSDAGWRLRSVLQTEPRIVLLASATSRFEEIDNANHALYDLFRTLTLRPLDTKECAVLWEAASGRPAPPETVRSLEILTGGSPRLLAIAARFGAGRSFRDLMADLLDLIDDHTEYFKSHLEALPAQERRVYLALADLWRPALTREIADRARLDTSKCSAQLARLVDRGVVQGAGGSARRKQYYLSERLYNVYYLLRRSRGPDRLIEALIRFMASYYSPRELVDIGVGIAREAGSFDAEMRALHRSAFERLMEEPALAGYREELLANVPGGFMDALDRDGTLPEAAKPAPAGLGPSRRRAGQLDGRTDGYPESEAARARIVEARGLVDQNRPEEALAVYDEVVRRFGESEAPALLEEVAAALVGKGFALRTLDRPEDALAVHDEVVRRFGESEVPALLNCVAAALAGKGSVLRTLDRPEEALAVCDEVVRRFGASEAPALLEEVAAALVGKGSALRTLDRPEEALAVCDEAVRRFGESETPALLEWVATALLDKGSVLRTLDRPEEALAACDEVVRRFGASEVPALLEWVATALLDKGSVLHGLDRPEEALAVCDEVVRRFGESEVPALLEWVAAALVDKGFVLRTLDRPEEALAIYDETVRRFGESEAPDLLEEVAAALVGKGLALDTLDRPEEALAVYDEVLRRFGESEAPALLQRVAAALVGKGFALHTLDRPEEALAVHDETVRRFGESEAPALLKWVAAALVGKGFALRTLDRPEEALAACDEVVRRFGESEAPALIDCVAAALVNKGSVLHTLDRPEDALAVCDEVVRRFGESEAPALLQRVAAALVDKGLALRTLNRPKEALAVYDEVVRRFGESESSDCRSWAGVALLGKAGVELALRRYTAAIETAGRVLEPGRTASRKIRSLVHLGRAKAILASGDPAACEQDIEAALEILPEIGSLPKEVLNHLAEFAVGIGAERMLELVRASPSADLLLPFTTALERELGLEPRVAREVEEVAEDIRRDLAELRKARADG